MERSKLGALATKVLALQARLDTVDIGLDDVVWELKALQGDAPAAAPPVRSRRLRARANDDEVLSRLAESGARDVAVKRYADHAELRIDGGAATRLTFALADLVEVLIDGHPGEAQRDGWMPLESIALALAKRSGEAVSRHAVSQRVWSLREHLRASRANYHLVQRARRRGARIVLRRTAAAAAPTSADREGDER